MMLSLEVVDSNLRIFFRESLIVMILSWISYFCLEFVFSNYINSFWMLVTNFFRLLIYSSYFAFLVAKIGV